MTLDLVQQLGTEWIEEMPDHAVLSDEPGGEARQPEPEKDSSDDGNITR